MHNFTFGFDLIYNLDTYTTVLTYFNVKHNKEEKNDIILKRLLKRLVLTDKWKNNNDILIQDETVFTIGDNIEVSYCPFSQKNIDIYDLLTFTGKLIFIDNKNDNAFFMIVNTMDKKIIIKTLERPALSFYGTTKGYFHTLMHKKI